MTYERIDQRVEKVAELLAFVAAHDRETLADLHAWFEESELAAQTAQPDVAAVAAAASRVSERLLLDDRRGNERLFGFVRSGGKDRNLAWDRKARHRKKSESRSPTNWVQPATAFPLPQDGCCPVRRERETAAVSLT